MCTLSYKYISLYVNLAIRQKLRFSSVIDAKIALGYMECIFKVSLFGNCILS